MVKVFPQYRLPHETRFMGAPIYHPLAEMNPAKARFCSAKPLYARPAGAAVLRRKRPETAHIGTVSPVYWGISSMV